MRKFEPGIYVTAYHHSNDVFAISSIEHEFASNVKGVTEFITAVNLRTGIATDKLEGALFERYWLQVGDILTPAWNDHLLDEIQVRKVCYSNSTKNYVVTYAAHPKSLTTLDMDCKQLSELYTFK